MESTRAASTSPLPHVAAPAPRPALHPTPTPVQVAPCPLTLAVHAGQVLASTPLPPLPTHAHEEAYIPVALARAQLRHVVADMHAMKAEHVDKLHAILDHYRTLETETQERHDARVRSLKVKGEAKVNELRARCAQLEHTSVVREAGFAHEKAGWMEEQATARRQLARDRDDWRRALEWALHAHEDAAAREQQAVGYELARVAHAAALVGRETQERVRNEGHLETEDAWGHVMRSQEHLATLHVDVKALHVSFAHAQVAMQARFEAHVTVARVVFRLIDAVVERQEHQTHVDRARKVQRELDELHANVDAAKAREASLQHRLTEVCERYERMEAHAVRDTGQLLVDAVVGTLEAFRATTAHARTQTPGLEGEWKVKVEGQGLTREDGSVALPNESLTLMSEADVVYGSDDALGRSKVALAEAKAKLEALAREKAIVKTAVKTWLAAFQRRFGREPTLEDQAQVQDKYAAFKAAEHAVKTQRAVVETLKQQHRTLGRQKDDKQPLAPAGALASRLADENQQDTEQEARLDRVPASALLVSTVEIGVEAIVRTTDTGTDAGVDERKEKRVSIMKKELEELRSHLTLPSRVATTFEDKAVQLEPSVASAVSDQVSSTASFVDAQSIEKTVERAREWDAQQHEQRLAGQDEIKRLTDEIEARKTEKSRLEVDIEQLRLHLELSEARDSEERLLSEAKARFAKDVLAVDDEAKSVGEHDGEEAEAQEALIVAEAKDEDDQDVDDEKEIGDAVEVREDTARSLQVVQLILDAVARGKTYFNRGDKAKCYQTYVHCATKCLAELHAVHDKHLHALASSLKRVVSDCARLPPARGSPALRRQLDVVRETCHEWLASREQQAKARQLERSARKETTVVVTHKPQKEDGKKALSLGGDKALDDAKHKVRALEAKSKADRHTIAHLEAALAKAETLQASTGPAALGNGPAALDRRVVELDKKHKRVLEGTETRLQKDVAALTLALAAAEARSHELQRQTAGLQQALSAASGQATHVGHLEAEVAALRDQTALVGPLTTELRDVRAQHVVLETRYREEQMLRKKYYNQIEDMKGKIRVFARCRPMSTSERERGCTTCVKFLDEFSLDVSGGTRGAKTFAYDQVFPPASTQAQVFEDTKNLLQSAVDGYNVCIFAYGQTGSGKTFTMTGTDGDTGLSPRAIHHLFHLADDCRANWHVTFHATMLELYNDALIDLFHVMDGGSAHDVKLEIKKNDKGMVVVQNAIMKPCTSPDQTLRFFEAANKKRQVGATKMNAESSRSHLIFSLLIESFNKTTKVTTMGKLSLVDLAGSERAGKTGATADRLKEAQAINKSLSALGDVIAALSSNEKFIPYRNNKLTQLMQDSLGGNAKTLMFVNISPADYNQEETVTSLTYASRVKLITNNANKTSESEQVNRLKAIIKQLRAGKSDVDLEGVLD